MIGERSLKRSDAAAVVEAVKFAGSVIIERVISRETGHRKPRLFYPCAKVN